MSWQLPTFRLWSYAFTFASGGLVATFLLHSRLNSSSLNAPIEKTPKHAFKQDAPHDSADARSLTDPSEEAKIDGGVKCLKKMFADKCGEHYGQNIGVDDLQHKHVRFSSFYSQRPSRPYQVSPNSDHIEARQ